MILNRTLAVFAILSLMPVQSIAACSTDGGTGTGTEYANMVLAGEGGGNWGATNARQESTASGAFQFTYGTLQELGYIDRKSRAVGADMFGPGEWGPDSDGNEVIWTGLNGVRSRQDFLTNQAVQVNALSIYTEKNLKIIDPDYSTTANGVPLTAGGVGYAAHFLGAGGFKQWQSCGYQPSCLPEQALAANGAYTAQTMNEMLMGRMAEGAEVDPSCIDPTQFDGELPGIVLMPWTRRT